jgi:hypothetical protein
MVRDLWFASTLSSPNPILAVSHRNRRSLRLTMRSEVKCGRTAAPSEGARPAELLADSLSLCGFVAADCKALRGRRTRTLHN